MSAKPNPKTHRQAYGEALAELGRTEPRLVVFDSDVAASSRSAIFGQEFPDRFFNVGIAEASMAAMAAGMATTGRTAFINTFASFMVLRAADPVRSLIAYMNLDVKLAGAYAGLSDSFDGASHHSIADIAFMRAMPNMAVVSPCDNEGIRLAVAAAFRRPGPVYLRIHRNEVADVGGYGPEGFVIGKGRMLREGADVTLIAAGNMVQKSMEAAGLLAGKGLRAGIIDMHTIKPLDMDLVLKAASVTGAVVTVEEHSIHGGLGSAVAEVLGASRPTRLRIIGVNDTFAESGNYEGLLDKYGLSARRIAGAVEEWLR